MVLLAFILFIGYNLVVFSYTCAVFEIEKQPRLFMLATSIINSFLLFIPVYVTEFQHEQIIMLLYILVYGLELRLFFRQKMHNVALGVLSFSTNFFAIRVAIMGCFSLAEGMSFTELFADQETRLIISMINFAIPIPYILVTRKIIPTAILNLLMTTRQNLIFSVVMLSSIYVSQIINTTLIYMRTPDTQIEKMAIAQIRSGIFSIFMFCIVMLCVHLFADLRKKAIKYNRISAELKKESELVKYLEDISVIEDTTGFYVRSVAEDNIDSFMKNQDTFFICFIDLDGLKYTNDTYGHEEGDWYIKNVADEISVTFDSDLISRIGGDEFLIVGKMNENIDIEEKLLRLSRVIEEISTVHKKQYHTSISYGLVIVDADNDLPVKELIKIADQKMYDNKRKMKKQRATIKVPNTTI